MIRLRLVTCDDIDYAYKSADRSRLEQLLGQRGNADEIIIVRQAMLDKGLLVERDITPEYYRSCREVILINAMMPLGRCVVHLSTDTLSV